MSNNRLIKDSKPKEQVHVLLKRKMTLLFLYVMHFINRSKTHRMISDGFFKPKTRDLRPEEIDFLKKGDPFNIEVDNQKMQGWRYGSGPVLLCVHGWASRGARFHSLFNDAHNAGFSLVIFDGPGHGDSEGETSSYFQMTNAVRAMVNYIGVENIAGLIGHSFGSGAIVNAVDKEKLNQPLVLIAPALDMKNILDEAFIKHGIPLSIFYTIISEYEKKYSYSLVKDNPIKLILKNNSPTLILHDTGDRTVDFKYSKEVVSNRQNNIKLVPTSGFGHSRILSDPKLVREIIDFFVNNRND